MSQNNLRYKNISNFIAIFIGIIVLFLIIFKVSFPIFKINNEKKDDFFIRNINEKKYLELKIKGGYPFHKILIKTSRWKKENKKVFLGKIYQDELGLYKSNKIIKNKNELNQFLDIKIEGNDIVNGELIKKGNFVYFISDSKYRAFANAETFDMLGFDWNKVRDNKGSVLNDLIKGNTIDKNIAYLPSSFVAVGQEIYLLGSGEKYLIRSKELEEYIKSKFSVIKINNKKLNALGEMKCGDTFWSNNVCEFEDVLGGVLPQATVFIELNDSLPAEWFSKIYTFDKFVSVVPKITLSNVKRNLILRYDQRLGFGNRVNK